MADITNSTQARNQPDVFTLVALAGIGAMAMNIYLPSMPAMVSYFETSPAKVQLTVSLFLAFNAVFQLVIGPLSDRYGRRPIMLSGLVIFCFASLACLLAPTIESFLVARVFQAAVVTGMILSRAAVRDMFSTDKAASMIGYVTMGMAIVPMFAPALGGWMEKFYGWQASFVTLLVFGILVLILAYFKFTETNQNRQPSVVAQFRAYPELLSSRRFWGYVIAAATCSGAFFAYLGGAPFVGSAIFGLKEAELGAYLSTPAIGYFIGNFISGRYAVRVGVNKMIIGGSFLAVTGMGLNLILFTFGSPGPMVFFGLMIAMGLGNGMCLPNAMSGMMSVRPHLAGSATGIGGTIMTGGGAALSVLASTIVDVESGATSLLWIMTVSSVFPMFAIGYVLWREREIQSPA